jgi:hypothetical protein
MPTTHRSGDTILNNHDWKTAKKAFDLQNKEFDAIDRLSKAWIALSKVAVVEDDYPRYRDKYEGALNAFIKAIRDNGRLSDASR